jgi:nitroreductase
MDMLEGITSRRTIRRFRGEPPSLETMREIAAAGMAAPSAGNGQPWRFVIALDPAKVDGITDTLGWLGGKPGAGERPRAHVAVLIPAGSKPGPQADGAAAALNMQLAAHAMGLGSCWFGVFKRETVAIILDVPPEWEIQFIISFGEPAEEPVLTTGEGRPERDGAGVLHVPKKPIDDVVSLDSFA